MKRKLFTPEQVIRILREAETGKLTILELCRKYGIIEVTICRWRKRNEGMRVSDAKRLESPVLATPVIRPLLGQYWLGGSPRVFVVWAVQHQEFHQPPRLRLRRW
jgi:Transposase